MFQPAVADRRYHRLIRVIDRNSSGKGNTDGFVGILFLRFGPFTVFMCVFTGGIVGHLVGKLLILVQLHRLFPGYGGRTRPGARKAGVLRCYRYVFAIVYGVINIVFNIIQISFGPGVYNIYRHTA